MLLLYHQAVDLTIPVPEDEFVSNVITARWKNLYIDLKWNGLYLETEEGDRLHVVDGELGRMDTR